MSFIIYNNMKSTRRFAHAALNMNRLGICTVQDHIFRHKPDKITLLPASKINIRAITVKSQPTKNARLLISGPNASGIVASFSQLLYNHSCDIIDCASESSSADDFESKDDHKLFFQRILFDHMHLNKGREEMEEEIRRTCHQFGMEYRLVSALQCLTNQFRVYYLCADVIFVSQQSKSWGDRRHRIAIFVSKYDHCLWELLLRHQAGELECNICFIISNHENLRHVAKTFDIPYYVFPVNMNNKASIETQQLELLQKNKIDVIVLARYMQILSERFLDTFSCIE